MNEILVSYFNDIYWRKNMDKNNINEKFEQNKIDKCNEEK